MTDEEAQAIAARAEAATPGQWGVDEEYDREAKYNKGAYRSLMTAIVSETGEMIVPLTFGRMSRMDNSLDAEFIAHAREDIPVLLSERSDLRRMLAAMYRVAVWAQEFHEDEFFEEFGDMTTLVGEVERTLKGGK